MIFRSQMIVMCTSLESKYGKSRKSVGTAYADIYR